MRLLYSGDMNTSLPLWLDTLACEINPDFVHPARPQLGDRVTLRVRLHRDAPVKTVLWHTWLNGENWSKPMTKVREGRNFQWWEITWDMEQPQWRFSFILQDREGAFWFVNRRGAAPHHQTQEHDWVLLAGAQFPSWVPAAPVYQIFPDRFAKGRSRGGIKTGEYESEGFYSRAMKWTDKPLEWSEGRCLDFFNGDLEGIRKKIPYLKDLGVGTLFLNPIFEAPSIHKYDCTDYFHVARALGGNKALRDLIRDLHQAGMRIILDISINHTGIGHPWAAKARKEPHSPEGSFYYHKPDGGLVTWLGTKNLPMLNYKSRKLRSLMYKNPGSVLKKWIREPFGIDGWRFDVGNYTGRLDGDQLGHEIFREVRQELKALNPELYLTGEHWQDSIDYLRGDQWDGSMNYFGCARALRGFAGERDRYIFGEDPKEIPLERGLTGQDLARQILQHFARMPDLVPHMQLNMLDSHDLFRLHNAGTFFRWELYRGLVIIQYLLPGTPNLYYGDEVGLEGWTHSVEGVRFPMEWREKKWDRRFLELYRNLNILKGTSAVLHQGGMKILFADENTLVLARYLGKEAVIGVVNKSSEHRKLEISSQSLGIGHLKDYFSSRESRPEGGIWKLELGPLEGGLWIATVED